VFNRHFIILIGIFLGVITLLTPVVAYGAFEWAYRGRIYPGIEINRAKGQRLKAKGVKIIYGEKVWEVSGEQLGVRLDWETTREKLYRTGRNGNFGDDLRIKYKAYREGITVEPEFSYNREPAEELAASVSGEIDRAAVEPKFRLADGRVTEFAQAGEGVRVIKNELENRLIQAVFSPQESVEVPVEVIIPVAPKGEMTAESLGIKQLLGKGISTYKGSIASRKHNVGLTAGKIDGILVGPEETFSFNQTVGEINKENGFLEAYVIKDGRTELGDGGGVCQVSTTLFRAVLAAGLPIVERRAHSYRVGYYEQNSPPGLDATVYAPTTDFKFKNDTPSYLLIQVKADNTAGRLAVELWGTGDGRIGKTTKPVIADQVPPPPDIYQDDPSLPSGQVKQVDWKAWGAKVKFDYTVTRGGEGIYSKTFVSNYKPWGAVYLRGTGG
jgi:vancomycin resistance protein YoaR